VDSGFKVAEELEVMGARGTVNNYVRFFTDRDEGEADEVIRLMRSKGFEVNKQNNEQNFSALNHGKVPAGQLEVWIGRKQSPLLPK